MKASAEAQLAAMQAQLADMTKRVFVAESSRRKLHNTIQELKGNIRSACRETKKIRNISMQTLKLKSRPEYAISILDYTIRFFVFDMFHPVHIRRLSTSIAMSTTQT